MNTKQLKQKILSLAISGKLVPQDPSDEPASELLKRIKAERESTVEKGRQQKATTDTSHYQQQPPFELPEGWVWCKLGEIFYLKAGENITSKDISEIKKEDFIYPCYGGNGIRGYTKQYNKEGIFSLIGRQGALCGNINIGKGKFFATEHAVVVNAFSETNVNWCFYFLKQLNLNQYATSTAQPGLSVNNINQIYIPLPPLKEQDRIANEIDRLFTLIEQLEEDKAALEQLVSQLKSKILSLAICGQLVPQDANDEPAEVLLKQINPEYKSRGNLHYKNLPKGWEVIPIKMVCKLNDGEKKKNVELPYLDVKYFRGKVANTTKKDGKFIPKNTTLILVDGENSGEIFYASREGYQGSTMKILKIEPIVDRMYILHFIKSYQKELKENKVGSAIPHLNKKLFGELQLPLPPLAEQQRIVEQVEKLFKQLDEIQNALAI